MTGASALSQQLGGGACEGFICKEKFQKSSTKNGAGTLQHVQPEDFMMSISSGRILQSCMHCVSLIPHLGMFRR